MHIPLVRPRAESVFGAGVGAVVVRAHVVELDQPQKSAQVDRAALWDVIARMGETGLVSPCRSHLFARIAVVELASSVEYV